MKNNSIKRLNKLATLILISACLSSASIQAADGSKPAKASNSDHRLDWWRAARFGLFIHWGPASVNGTEISWSRKGHPFDHPGDESVPAEVYDNLYKQFNPVKFDANAWMRLAKDAGMKYVVFITKHHDGFSMWPTKLRPEYSIAATPFKRDICKEIADAARKHGIRLGWYYSTRDWTHPDYLKGDNAKYNDFYHGQVRELLSNYGPVDIMWFDHVAGNWRDYRFEELFSMLYQLQPDILVNNRAARFFLPTDDKPTPQLAELVRGDFGTPEQEVGAFQLDPPWESCITMTECKGGGGWSYRPDGRNRSFAECLTLLIQCAGGDGNLLLNVGPLPSGEIDPAQVAVLEQMGQWLRRNGESIYGTRGGPWKPSKKIVSTRKGDKVFVHILGSDVDTIVLPRLPRKVLRASVLSGGRVETSEQDGQLLISVPQKLRKDAVDTIIVMTLDGSAMDIPPIEIPGQHSTGTK